MNKNMLYVVVNDDGELYFSMSDINKFEKLLFDFIKYRLQEEIIELEHTDIYDECDKLYYTAHFKTGRTHYVQIESVPLH